jgi:hypothetical protein
MLLSGFMTETITLKVIIKLIRYAGLGGGMYLRCGSAAVGLLGMRVRILPGLWMSVCCECCMLSGRGLCDGLITRPEEFYKVRCV